MITKIISQRRSQHEESCLSLPSKPNFFHFDYSHKLTFWWGSHHFFGLNGKNNLFRALKCKIMVSHYTYRTKKTLLSFKRARFVLQLFPILYSFDIKYFGLTQAYKIHYIRNKYYHSYIWKDGYSQCCGAYIMPLDVNVETSLNIVWHKRA